MRAFDWTLCKHPKIIGNDPKATWAVVWCGKLSVFRLGEPEGLRELYDANN
jgi:hypothetical protein